MKKLICILILVVLVSGCANTGIVKLSPDTYMLSRVDHGGIFGNAAKMKTNVIREANEFAESQGKIAIPLAIREKPMGIGFGGFAEIEYQFRVVDKNDPEAKRVHLIKDADISIKRNDYLKSDINIHTKDVSEGTSDMYTELMKLNDLKEKGILSEDEFNQQKQKILEKY